MKVSELRTKSVQELGSELHALAKELFNIRMQKGFAQSPHNHLYKQVRKKIAQVKTILSEKEGSKS